MNQQIIGQPSQAEQQEAMARIQNLPLKFVVPVHDENVFQNYILPSLKQIGCGLIQVRSRPGEKESLFEKYNQSTEALIKLGLKETDVVVYCHEDVRILDSYFAQKVAMIFNQKPEIGLVGVAGANEFTDRGGWWMNKPDKLRGHVIQENEQGQLFHLVKGPIGFFDDIVAIDGCMMMVKGKVLLEGLRWDNQTYDGRDFYDIDFCFEVLSRGYKIGVADILLHHKSMGTGSMQEPWHKAKEKFFKKWKSLGCEFPITINNFKVKQVEVVPNVPEEPKVTEIEI